MDPSGNIRLLTENEPLRDNETSLSEDVKKYLEQFRAEDRLTIFKGLTSKNKASKRRAAKKIAKASRQRNRR